MLDHQEIADYILMIRATDGITRGTKIFMSWWFAFSNGRWLSKEQLAEGYDVSERMIKKYLRQARKAKLINEDWSDVKYQKVYKPI